VKDLGVLGRGILGCFCATTLDCNSVTLVLEALRGDETLNLRCLGVWLCALLLGGHFTTDNEFADIILLAETKETTDLRGTLGTETLGVNNVCETRNWVVARLDDGESEDREVHANDAATDRLPLALTSSSWSVAGVAV